MKALRAGCKEGYLRGSSLVNPLVMTLQNQTAVTSTPNKDFLSVVQKRFPKREEVRSYTTQSYTTQSYTTQSSTIPSYTTQSYTAQSYTTQSNTIQSYTIQSYTTQRLRCKE